MITYEEAHRVFRYDVESGKLYWKEKTSNSSRIIVGDEVGFIYQHGRTSYRKVKYHGIGYRSHRIIWLMVYGRFPQAPLDEIDHIDGDGLNNRIGNLRVVNRSKQCRNRQMSSNNKSGYTGVSLFKKTGKFRVQIKINDRAKHLGYFDTPELASAVYQEAKTKYGYSERHGI